MLSICFQHERTFDLLYCLVFLGSLYFCWPICVEKMSGWVCAMLCFYVQHVSSEVTQMGWIKPLTYRTGLRQSEDTSCVLSLPVLSSCHFTVSKALASSSKIIALCLSFGTSKGNRIENKDKHLFICWYLIRKLIYWLLCSSLWQGISSVLLKQRNIYILKRKLSKGENWFVFL